MLVTSLSIPRARFEAETGWELKPEGACKGAVCVPLERPPTGEVVDVAELAKQLGLPLVKADDRDLWALGPESVGARALTTAQAPELVLPDLDGVPFHLSSLRGRKVVVYAWAPY